MKYIKLIISIFLGLAILYSCVKNEFDLLDTSEPGFWLDLYATTYVEATIDLNLDTLVYDSVNVSVQYVIPELTRDFNALELHKRIVNSDGDIIEDYIYATFSKESLPLDTTFIANSVAELYEGLDFSPDSLDPELAIEFEAILKLSDGTEMHYLYGEYILIPVLNGFCSLPEIPTGNWLAKNNNTLYTRTVWVEKPSPVFTGEDDGRALITDFGLDWSNWEDVWYCIEFKIICPVGNDPRYVIELLPDGNYDPGPTWTGTGRSGAEETKLIRVMPYAYEDNTIVGYYDAENQEIIFEDVPLIDTWWGADNHTVNLTFTYIGK